MTTDLVARFEGVDLEIIDKDGERWVTAKQLADALGYSDHRKLLTLISRNLEEFEGKTLVLKLSTSHPNSPGDTIINYHGVIRVGMISDAPKAPRFRDWAERVLYAVMTRGHYSERQSRLSQEDLTKRQKFELLKMRIWIGKKLAKDPQNPILLGMLQETHGQNGAIWRGITYRAAKIFSEAQEERRAARKPAPDRPPTPSYFDQRPEMREFIRSLFKYPPDTYTEMGRKVAERFGLEKPPTISTIRKEWKRWNEEQREQETQTASDAGQKPFQKGQ